MKMFQRTGEKRRFDDIDVEDEEAIGTLCRLSGDHPTSPGCTLENEKRIRREIANSNERRRMQSINAGFASLKQLLPNTEGEKLSKAAILQQTADYIFQLEQERKDLITQNNHLKKFLHQESTDGSSSDGEGPLTDILSTIQDLQNNPSASKLPNTEFHQFNNNNNSKNKNRTIVSADIAAVEEAPMVLPCHEDAAEDTDAAARTFVAMRAEIGRESSKHRARLDDKVVKTTWCYPGSKLVGYTRDDAIKDEAIKDEPVEYTAIPFGVEQPPHAVPNTKVVVRSCNSPSVLQTNTVSRCYSINTTPHHRLTHPSSTIVTILPPTPPHPNSMPASLPAVINKVISSHRVVESGRSSPRVEVEPTSRIPTPDEMEYSAGEASPPHHDSENYAGGGITVMTSNSKSSKGQSCQKSLDTICEAIRHLEGDHMFTANEEHQGNRIEEEIITEETYAIEDSSNVALQDATFIRSSFSQNDIVQRTKNDVYEMCPSPIDQSIQHRLQFHPTTTMVYGIDDRVSSEPQEVPLELTTSHRIERLASRSPPHSSISARASPFCPPLNSLQTARSGVIVVKQA